MGKRPLSKINTLISCFNGVPFPLLLRNPTIKLILCEGTTRVIKNSRKKIKAGEIMFEFPECVVCHADSFILGRRIPILSIHDHLVPGHSYFVLPIPEGGGGGLLSASTLSCLGSPSPTPSPKRGQVIKFCGGGVGGYNSMSASDESNSCSKSPFEYIKDKDGRVHMIKVVPEFIARIIASNYGGSSPSNNNCGGNNNKLICSTPELQKQYQQLVRAKDQAWSPKLETISECKIRFSPCRFIGLEWKKKEKTI